MGESVVFWCNVAVGGVENPNNLQQVAERPPRAKLILLFSFESVRKEWNEVSLRVRSRAWGGRLRRIRGVCVLLNLKPWQKQINEQNTGNNNGRGRRKFSP